MSTPIQDLLESSVTSGIIDDTLVNILKETSNFTHIQTTLANIRLNIYDKLQDISALVAQASYIILCVDDSKQKISHADTLQLIACTRTYVYNINFIKILINY